MDYSTLTAIALSILGVITAAWTWLKGKVQNTVVPALAGLEKKLSQPVAPVQHPVVAPPVQPVAGDASDRPTALLYLERVLQHLEAKGSTNGVESIVKAAAEILAPKKA